jgi:hypothetical protein
VIVPESWVVRTGHRLAELICLQAIRIVRLSSNLLRLVSTLLRKTLFNPKYRKELQPGLEAASGLRNLFEDEWECVDQEPQFEVAAPWPRGYVLVTCLLAGEQRMRVRFYLGRSSSSNEFEVRDPSSNAYQRTSHFSTVLCIGQDIERLRFGPCDALMRFHISQFRMTGISGLEYGWRLLQDCALPLLDRATISLNHAIWAWDYVQREGLKAGIKRAVEIVESWQILTRRKPIGTVPLPVEDGPGNPPNRSVSELIRRNWDLISGRRPANRSVVCRPPAAVSSSGTGRKLARVAVHVSPRGNYFFREIALLFQAAFRELGAEATLSGRYEYEDAEDLLHFVVAPHEYFLLATRGTGWNPFPRERTLLYNTEQLHTSWFKEASRHFGKGFLVLDLDASTARAQRSLGLPCEHVPLGYCPSLQLFSGLHPLPLNSATLALAPEVRDWSDHSRPLRDRPIDVIFFGRNTPRRGEFFARNARFFADYRCFFRIDSMQDPLHPGINTPIDTETTTSLSRRAKIALNIHRDESRYFEWHRIAVLSIWQETLVLSEPSTLSAPFVPGRDYVEADMDLIPATIEYLLRSEEGMRHAERIREHARKTFFERCLLRDHLARVFESRGMSVGNGEQWM